MKGDFVIRRCRLEDMAGVLRLETASFPDPYDRFTFYHLLRDPGTTFLVADSEGELVGYLAVVSQTRQATIVSIATSPSKRREGIGSAMMVSALGGLDTRVTRVLLQVDVGNQAAIRFYRKFGFKQIDIIRRYYKNGDDAFVMSLDLADYKSLKREGTG